MCPCMCTGFVCVVHSSEWGVVWAVGAWNDGEEGTMAAGGSLQFSLYRN